tara:strand:+ start:15602 stop:16213 length:612 start_codon:yes stop_codon:yes gene_type:complete
MAVANLERQAAVNIGLTNIGLAPVATLTGALPAVVSQAVAVLDEVNRNMQAKGLHWNTEYDYPLVPDGSGYITWPDSLAKITLTAANNPGEVILVRRSSKLYDRTARTNVWADTLLATVVVYLEWDDLPQAARQYVAVRAARTLSDRVVGSQEAASLTEQDEFLAKSEMMDEESLLAQYNVFDNYSSSGALRRTLGQKWHYNR